MSELSLTDFLGDTKPSGGSAEHLNLKAMGKAIVFLHPGSKIYKRNVYWFPFYGEVEKNGSKSMEVYDLNIVCPGLDINPIAKLRKALRDDKSIDLDEVILKVGKGKDAVSYKKGDIIGEQGYDWRKNLAYKTEYLFGVIDVANPDSVHPFVAPKSLGKKITKVIEEQIEDEGDVKGNPFVTPYAFRLTYDSKAQAADMYNCSWNKAEATDEIKELIKGDGPDNKPLIEPATVEKIAWLVKQALVYDAEDLGLDLSAADDFDPADLNKRGNEDSEEAGESKEPKKEKKEKKPLPKKEVKRPETSVDDEDEDEEEDDMIECPECGTEVPADSETCSSCGNDISPF